MKFAFCLFNYFPYGGLQRDFLRIAQECVRRGHQVNVYTMQWEGEKDPSIPVILIPIKGWQNHTRAKSYVKQLQSMLAVANYDAVIGFNKMSGLDVYYAADTCYQAKVRGQRPWWYSLMPRYRHYITYEKAVFARENPTRIFLIAPQQQFEFQRYYNTPSERFNLLPPGISKDRIQPSNADEIRRNTRHDWNIASDQLLLLMVGSGFKTKGLDRVLYGIAALPEEIKTRAHLFVIGQDTAIPFKVLAEKLGVTKQIRFLGGRNDVPAFLLAADLLVHPAYNENTGTVLLEAVASGLPVLTTDVCGYAHYIDEAECGKVLASPYRQQQFNDSLSDMLLSANRETWRKNAINFAKTADIYSMPARAVDLLETQNFSFTSLTFDKMMALRGEVFRELENRRTQKISFNNKNFFLKQHFGVGWKEIFKNLLQGRLPILGAKNEWLALNHLQSLNIAAPKVTAFGKRGYNPARQQSFLLTEALPKTISLEDLCKNWRKAPPSFALKKRLIMRVAHIAKTLHENGINHRDFYICHFLLGEECLYLIDLHRAQVRDKVPQRWLIKDLAGLYFSSKDIGLTERDLLRFIKYYRSQSLCDIFKHELDLWKKVRNRGEKLYRKHA